MGWMGCVGVGVKSLLGLLTHVLTVCDMIQLMDGNTWNSEIGGVNGGDREGSE